MVTSTPLLPRPASPLLPVLDRPPLLSDRTPSNSSHSSRQSLSSVLSTPSDASAHTTRVQRAPPSAFSRRHSAVPLFDGQDTREDVLKALSIIDTEWELVDKTIPSEPPPSKRKGARALPSIMSTSAEQPPRVPQKKASFLRRLTVKQQPAASAPAPEGPPQLPRMSTFLQDSERGFMSTPNGSVHSGHAQNTSPPRARADTPSNQLPPGAAPSAMSPTGPGHESAWNQTPQAPPKTFKVQGRPTGADTPPASAPMARPNGPASMPNGMPNGIAHPKANGTANGGPQGARGPRAMGAKELPMSPPTQRPLPMSPPQKQQPELPNQRQLPNGPPTSPPVRPQTSPQARPPTSPVRATMTPPMRQGSMPNGTSPPMNMPQPYGRPAAPGFSASHLAPRGAPMAALASPPVSPSDGRFMPHDPRGGFPQQTYSRPPLLDSGNARPGNVIPTRANGTMEIIASSQHHQRPPNMQSRPQMRPQMSQPRPQMSLPPGAELPMGAHGYRPPGADFRPMSPPGMPSSPPGMPPGQSQGMRSPPMRPQSPPMHQVQSSPPRMHSRPHPFNSPPIQEQPLPPPPNGGAPTRALSPAGAYPGMPRGFAPPGPPPSAMQQRPPMGSSPDGVINMRRTSNPHIMPQRPAPAPPPYSGPSQQMPRDLKQQVLASPPARTTSVRRPARDLSSAGTQLQIAAGTTPPQQSFESSPDTPSRPKIVIPQGHNSVPPPAPQPYTAPVMAAAVAATTPTGPAPVRPPPVQTSNLKSPIDIEFGKSPTLPSLVDPRTAPPSIGESVRRRPADPYGPDATRGATIYHGLGNGLPSTIPNNQLPPRTRSATNQARRIASSPLASPSCSTPSSPARERRDSVPRSASAQASAPRAPSSTSTDSPRSSVATQRAASRMSGMSVLNRPRPKLKNQNDKTMTFMLSHPMVTVTLLPYLNINSFLNVLGSDDDLRKFISGEMVGRWVMREWGITVEKERGRSWPGLTVWEGFLESLLHDPAVYSTYPTQYHNLLRHLSLSHSLIVLFLRTLPPAAFPYAPPLPFEDDLQLPPLHKSSSVGSFGSMQAPRRPGSRAASHSGSETGSMMPGKMPRRERVLELVMPEPLSAQPKDAPKPPSASLGHMRKAGRRGSIGSMASFGGASLGLGRKRSNSTSAMNVDALSAEPTASQPALPIPQGKTAFPPVSFPSAKRYEFRRYGDAPLSPAGLPPPMTSRPGSIMSLQSSNMAHGSQMGGHTLRHTRSTDTLPVPPPIGGGKRGARSSLGSSSSRRSDIGGSESPQRRWGSPTQGRVEPAFERPPPYMTGRAPILRVFVPVSERVPRWPSAEGAAATWRELEKCGASKRMRLGDIVVNTALHRPTNTEHVLLYIPFVQHKLVPLEYVHCATGHLPHYLDAFALSPTYYDPFLPTPQILYLDFAPFAQQAMNSLRLAYDWRDVTTASGARIATKRYLHVAGLEIQAHDRVAPEWCGMISLEAEGTAEGRADMEARFGGGDPSRAVMGPWEVVRERSMLGSLWLKLIREQR